MFCAMSIYIYSYVICVRLYSCDSSFLIYGLFCFLLSSPTPNQAEARLAAKRQARAEAREIRMRELDRQQKEQEHHADRVYDMQQAEQLTPRTRLTVNNHVSLTPSSSTGLKVNSMSSRRSSEDSLEEEGRSLRDLRHELKVNLLSIEMMK